MVRPQIATQDMLGRVLLLAGLGHSLTHRVGVGWLARGCRETEGELLIDRHEASVQQDEPAWSSGTT